jgi:hypothetical protein
MWTKSEQDAVSGNVDLGLVSSLTIPAGLTSQDGSAVVGLNGHLFLAEGSNKMSALYNAPKDEKFENLIDAWGGLFSHRADQSRKRGVQYMQLVIPEKLSVMNRYALLPVDGPTTALCGVEAAMLEEKSYLSAWEAMKNWQGEDDPYLSTDTHFSAAGAQHLFSSISCRIDDQVTGLIDDVRHSVVRYAKGDLSERFHGIPFHSRILEPCPEALSEYAAGLKMVERFFPPGNKATGRRFRWENASAPSQKKVVVFGNSFFSIGDWAGLLSWWGKHIFREFHFVWDPAFDWELVERLAPDVVIGQTVERFLPSVPAQ